MCICVVHRIVARGCSSYVLLSVTRITRHNQC